MLLIMATGNYNFFNVLYGALCLSLADDRWWRGTEKPQEGRRILRFLELAFNACAVAALCYLTAFYCFDWDTLEPKLMFTQSSFNLFVAQCRIQLMAYPAESDCPRNLVCFGVDGVFLAWLSSELWLRL